MLPFQLCNGNFNLIFFEWANKWPQPSSGADRAHQVDCYVICSVLTVAYSSSKASALGNRDTHSHILHRAVTGNSKKINCWHWLLCVIYTQILRLLITVPITRLSVGRVTVWRCTVFWVRTECMHSCIMLVCALLCDFRNLIMLTHHWCVCALLMLHSCHIGRVVRTRKPLVIPTWERSRIIPRLLVTPDKWN